MDVQVTDCYEGPRHSTKGTIESGDVFPWAQFQIVDTSMWEYYRSREDPPGKSKFNRSTWNLGQPHVNRIDSKFINRKALDGPTFNVKPDWERTWKGK